MHRRYQRLRRDAYKGYRRECRLLSSDPSLRPSWGEILAELAEKNHSHIPLSYEWYDTVRPRSQAEFDQCAPLPTALMPSGNRSTR